MRTAITVMFLSMTLILPFEADSALRKKKSVEDQRTETLDRLYEEKPSVQEMVGKAVGHAVFSNTGINVLLLSTANGKGIAHDNQSDKDIYMNMFSAGGGIGLGVKKFSAVFIFHSRDAFDQFVEKGWNFTGQADVAATTDAENQEQVGSMEGTVGLNEGVTVYQMTKKGLALQATLQGTKHWQDDDLNQ